MHVWQVQEAKAKLTQFINQAKDTPQIISRHGKCEIIAMSLRQYHDLISCKRDITSFFRASPLCEVTTFTTDRDTTLMREIDL